MINIKCSNCGKEFDITRNKCPYCEDSVKTSCKFYCGTCESKLKFGDFLCKKCGKYPDEIIVEQKNGKRIKTDFTTVHEKGIKDIYKGKVFFRYVVIPHLLYWGSFIIFGLFLSDFFSGLSLCSLDSNCGNSSDGGGALLVIIIFFTWILCTMPFLLGVIALYYKYVKKTNFDSIECEKSNIKFKCNHCGKYTIISRGIEKCPNCDHDIKIKLYCGKCETEIESGEIICSHCYKIPKEIIVVTPDGERVKTTFSEE